MRARVVELCSARGEEVERLDGRQQSEQGYGCREARILRAGAADLGAQPIVEERATGVRDAVDDPAPGLAVGCLDMAFAMQAIEHLLDAVSSFDVDEVVQAPLEHELVHAVDVHRVLFEQSKNQGCQWGLAL